MEIVLIYSTRIVIFEVKNLNYENELHSEAQRTKRYRSKRILTFTIIMTVIASLILVPTFTSAVAPNQSLNPQAYSCSGNAYQTYSGQVLDQEQYGLEGVVLYFFTPGIYVGGSTATVESDSSGDWSVQLISCVYDSDLYWQSMTDGPYLTEETNVPASGSSYTVNVWIIPINYNLTYEYPYSLNVSIKTVFGSNMEFGINANISGNVGSKFLGDDISGFVGTDLQLSSSDIWSASSREPYMTYYAAGQAIHVEAANGTSISYVEQYDPSELNFQAYDQPPTNPLTMQDVINGHGSHVDYQGALPYGNTTWSHSTGSLTEVSAGMSVTAGFPFGSVTFSTYVKFSSDVNNSISVTLNNSGSQEEYYVVWQGGLYSNGTLYYGGPDYSIWYYGTSPPQ